MATTPSNNPITSGVATTAASAPHGSGESLAASDHLIVAEGIASGRARGFSTANETASADATPIGMPLSRGIPPSGGMHGSGTTYVSAARTPSPDGIPHTHPSYRGGGSACPSSYTQSPTPAPTRHAGKCSVRNRGDGGRRTDSGEETPSGSIRDIVHAGDSGSGTACSEHGGGIRSFLKGSATLSAPDDWTIEHIAETRRPSCVYALGEGGGVKSLCWPCVRDVDSERHLFFEGLVQVSGLLDLLVAGRQHFCWQDVFGSGGRAANVASAPKAKTQVQAQQQEQSTHHTRQQ